MNNIKQFIKLSLKYWYLLLLGIIFTSLFSVFSSISLVAIQPTLDYIMNNNQSQVLYNNFGDFSHQINLLIQNFFSKHAFFDLFSLDKSEMNLYKEQFSEILTKTDSFMLLKSIVIMVIISLILKNIFYLGHKSVFILARGRLTRDVRDMLFQNYVNKSLAYFQKHSVGDFLARIINDCAIINRDLLMSFYSIIHNFITASYYLVFAFFINYKLMLYGLIIIPIFTFLITILGKKIKKYAKRLQNKASDLLSFVEEKLNAMIIVKAFANEDFELRNFNKINKKFYKYWSKGRIYESLNRPISEISGTLIGIIIFFIGGYQVLSNPESNMTFGSFGLFLLLVFSAMHPLKVITKNYTKIKKGLVSLDRVYDIINHQTLLRNKKNPISKKTFEKKIKLDNVSFAYEKEKYVLKDINLEINKGENIAFVGSSGSGKTTLVKLLPRLFDTTKGSISIDGTPIKDLNLFELRRLFGTVTQKAHLFTKSIYENISYANPDKLDKEKVHKASKIAFADEFIEKLDDKYATMLEEKGSNFSGGQQQRISIARALYNEPPILIFDEATSALDTESEQKVQAAIENATKNHTVIVIAHRLSTILNSDRIVVMDEGEIIGIGKHDKLLTTCPKYKKLYEMQFI